MHTSQTTPGLVKHVIGSAGPGYSAVDPNVDECAANAASAAAATAALAAAAAAGCCMSLSAAAVASSSSTSASSTSSSSSTTSNNQHEFHPSLFLNHHGQPKPEDYYALRPQPTSPHPVQSPFVYPPMGLVRREMESMHASDGVLRPDDPGFLSPETGTVYTDPSGLKCPGSSPSSSANSTFLSLTHDQTPPPPPACAIDTMAQQAQRDHSFPSSTTVYESSSVLLGGLGNGLKPVGAYPHEDLMNPYGSDTDHLNCHTPYSQLNCLATGRSYAFGDDSADLHDPFRRLAETSRCRPEFDCADLMGWKPTDFDDPNYPIDKYDTPISSEPANRPLASGKGVDYAPDTLRYPTFGKTVPLALRTNYAPNSVPGAHTHLHQPTATAVIYPWMKRVHSKNTGMQYKEDVKHHTHYRTLMFPYATTYLAQFEDAGQNMEPFSNQKIIGLPITD
ncbi:unnamed protein product [Echinostoma caproni]|uniref:Homeobox protein araucan n=1 Tax=Echinostoma caproni TaxID=27848 RepID=A0A183AA21_9TREM|nr:unnamed protein product [Echinostoma caproni]